jgi:hypothetical protein
MKKNVFMKMFVGAFFAAILVLSSCSKIDYRDQFEGTYLLNVNGSFTVTIYGETYTEPISASNATLTLTKSSSSATSMIVSGYFNTEAEVSGNTIIFDPETTTETDEDITIIMTITHNSGTLSNNTLSFTSTIAGDAYYEGTSFPITGNLNNVAYKQ